ncbi:MAG: glycosyltransferase [Aulosira sp. DedQUE10]|nr:glycosyltransferase [Aulosira sp. DedQUE10]
MIENKETTKVLQSRILYIQYTNPAGYPPLEHSSRILAQEGWEILFLGTGALGAGNLKFPSHPNITVHQLPFCLPGWRQKLHYIQFCLWVLIWTLRWQPQWVYASDLLACPIAAFLSFLPDVRLIYHEHDSLSTAPKSTFLHLCLTTRKWLAHRAALCILPNQKRADRFDQEVNSQQQAFCVWNCPAQEEVIPPRLIEKSDDIWVLYHGSIVPERLPLTVLNALSDLPETVKLRAIGYETVGYKGYVQKLREVSTELGLSQRIELLDAMPRKDLLKWCQQSHIGLAFMPVTSQDVNLLWMTGASNKPFDYLACGLALVVSDLPDWKQMYVEPGYGLACNPENPASIATVLRWYLEHPVEMREMGEQARKRILEEWNYEMQFEVVKNKMFQGLQ